MDLGHASSAITRKWVDDYTQRLYFDSTGKTLDVQVGHPLFDPDWPKDEHVSSMDFISSIGSDGLDPKKMGMAVLAGIVLLILVKKL